MVWACCCRSVDTRTYNATCIGCSLWLSRRRHRPAQDKLVCLVPPVLPIWLLADLPPDLEGAPHRRPPAAAASLGRATPADQPAAAAAAATKQDEAGHDGSSRTCHLRSNHRTHRPLRQTDPRLDDPTAAPSRPGRPVDLAGAGRLHPAAPGPPGRQRPAAAVGAAPTSAATLALPGAPRVSAAAVRARLAGCRTETLRMLLRPAQGPGLRARGPPPCAQQAQEQAAQDRTGCLTGPAHPPTSVDGQPSMPKGLNHKLSTTAALSGFGCANGTDGHEPDGAAATMTSPAPGQDRWSLARPTGRAVGGSPARSTLPADRPLLRVHRPPVVPAPARMTTRNACANIAKVMWRYQAS